MTLIAVVAGNGGANPTDAAVRLRRVPTAVPLGTEVR